MKIDMHCHLDLYQNPFEVAKECDDRGIYLLSVTTTPKAWEGTKLLAHGSSRIRTALGLHPQLAHHRANELELFDALLPEAKYIGEIGLDGGTNFKKHWDIQLKVFRHILKTSHSSGGRIMSIHSIRSASEVLDELESIDGIPLLHWFTGIQGQLKRAINMGCWFTVGPAMLNTKKGQALVSMMPKDRILTETDGPFAKHNGQLLMPWNCEIATEQLSELWQTPVALVHEQLEMNLKYLLKFNH